MATEAARLMLQCVRSGSLSLFDMEIERRPYHKNCSCALHKSKGMISTTCFHHNRNISFPKKLQSGNEWSMSISASKFSYPSSPRHNVSVVNIEEINQAGRIDILIKPERKVPTAACASEYD